MADGGGRQRGGAETSVPDDELASAIAAETARVAQTGQVPIRADLSPRSDLPPAGGEPAPQFEEPIAVAGAGSDGSGPIGPPGSPSVDAKEPQPDARGAHRASAAGADVAAGEPARPAQETSGGGAGRTHGRRAASRAPRLRTATTPIQVPPPVSGADGSRRDADRPVLDDGPLSPGEAPWSDHAVSPPTDITTLPPSVLPPQTDAPALVWAPADPFFEDAPRPTGRSSYVPPDEPGLTELAPVPRAPGLPPARLGGSGGIGYGDTGYGDTGYGDTGSGDIGHGDTGSADIGSGDTDPEGPERRPAARPRQTPEEPASDARASTGGAVRPPDGRGFGPDSPTRTERGAAGFPEPPATVALPVQRASVEPIPDSVLRGFVERAGSPAAPPTQRVQDPPTVETRRELRARHVDSSAAVPVAAGAAQNAAVERPAAPGSTGPADSSTVPIAASGPGLWSTLAVVAGALGTPLAIVLGIAVGGTGASVLAPLILVVGVLPTVPAVVRLAVGAGRTGLGTTGLARVVLGRRAGTVAGLLLLLARTLVLVEVLLATGLVAEAFSPVLATGAVLAPRVPAVAATILAGVIAIIATVWRPRVTRVIVVAYSVFGLVATGILLVLLPTSDSHPALGGAGDVATALAGFCAVGLVLVLNVADVARGRAGGTSVAALVGALGGAAVGVLVLIAAIGVGRAVGLDPVSAAPRFVDGLSATVGSRVIAFVGFPIFSAVQALSVLLLRFAADSAAESIGRRRAAPVGAIVLGVVATVIAVVLLASGADAVDAVTVLVPLLGVPLAAWTGALAVTPFENGPVVSVSSRARMLLVAGVAVGTLLGWLLADGLLGPGWQSPLLRVSASGGLPPLLAVPVLALVVALVVGALGACAALFVDGRGPFARTDELEGAD